VALSTPFSEAAALRHLSHFQPQDQNHDYYDLRRSAPEGGHYRQGIEFKRRVLIFLLRHGFGVADPNDRDSKVTELTGSPATFASIDGLEPWFIDVRTSRPEDIAAALRDVSEKAQIEASEWPVSVMARPGHDIEDPYALMRLRVLAAISAGSVPETPSLSSRHPRVVERREGTPPYGRRRAVPAPRMEFRQRSVTPASLTLSGEAGAQLR